MAHPLEHPGGLVACPAWLAQPPPQGTERPVPDGLDGLQDLALQGRWREVVQRCRSATASRTADVLSLGAFHVLALLKLRMAEEAAGQLAKLGSLDDPVFLAGRDHGGASLVPFALRVMRAELPWRLGQQQDGVDRLHALLHWCARRLEQAQQQQQAEQQRGGRQEGGHQQQQQQQQQAAAAELWQLRHRGMLLLLAGKHCRLRQYTAALTLLDRLLQRNPSDAEAWTEAGTVQAMLGDLSAAQRSLQRAEQLLLAGGAGVQGAEAAEDSQHRQGLVHRNRGLLHFLQHDYRGAAAEYSAALAANSADAAAASNQAVALMYSCQLTEAVQVLERAFQRAPHAMMQEAVVCNLATLYELMPVAGTASKRHMADWVSAAAPDDFDLACTKTAGA